MPNTARELRAQLGLPKQNYGYIPEVLSIMLPAGHSIGKPSPLFTKIEDKQVEELRKKYAGRQEPTPPREAVSVPTDMASLEAAVAKQVRSYLNEKYFLCLGRYRSTHKNILRIFIMIFSLRIILNFYLHSIYVMLLVLGFTSQRS